MVEAKLKCSKVPIICTNQCGRSHNYCNGNCTCVYQVAVVECVDARQDKGSAEQQSGEAPHQHAIPADALREIAAITGEVEHINQRINGCLSQLNNINKRLRQLLVLP